MSAFSVIFNQTNPKRRRVKVKLWGIKSGMAKKCKYFVFALFCELFGASQRPFENMWSFLN